MLRECVFRFRPPSLSRKLARRAGKPCGRELLWVDGGDVLFAALEASLARNQHPQPRANPLGATDLLLDVRRRELQVFADDLQKDCIAVNVEPDVFADTPTPSEHGDRHKVWEQDVTPRRTTPTAPTAAPAASPWTCVWSAKSRLSCEERPLICFWCFLSEGYRGLCDAISCPNCHSSTFCR